MSGDAAEQNLAISNIEKMAAKGHIHLSVRQLCAKFAEGYWLQMDRESGYPTEFVRELTDSSLLGVQIPERYGSSGLGVLEATAVMEEICRSGAHAGVCHAQMYLMGSVLDHGSEEQKNTYLPKFARGELQLQSFGVTGPITGTDTTSLQTTAKRLGDKYVINGQKLWISRIEQSDVMLLLARTTDRDKVSKKTQGLSAFLLDVASAKGNGLTIRPIESMINHDSCELFFDDLAIPAENLLGKERQGFKVILDGMNAQRISIAAKCVGDGRYFTNKTSAYAAERQVFNRPIGANQGVQLPIARAHTQVKAAALMVEKAANVFDGGLPCEAEANMAKIFASEAACQAGDVCMQTLASFAFTKEYHIERKFR